ncbi:TPA: hypothetical protein ACH3X3_005383 [Trebouxia sp. C0006]
MSRTICIIAAVLLGLCLQSECAFVKLEVQLAISDDTFSSFGTIYGHVEENSLLFSKLIWERPEYTASQLKAFAEVVEQNGFVKIKVSNNVEQPSGKFVYGSARARCLAQSAVDEQVLLYLDNGGYISAVEYRVGCNEQPTKLPSDWSQPQQVVALCRFPETAEPLRQTATPGLEPSGLPEGTTIYPESQDPGAAQGMGGDLKKKAPVKDERSWIMKNWIFLIPAGMLLMNILGAADTTPAARPGQTAAPSTASAAPATTGRISAGGKSRKGR